MYYNNIKINYLVKSEKGVLFGGSSTLEGAEKIKKEKELEHSNFPKAWGEPPAFHIEKVDG
jgi:hypothetical protein